MAKWVASRTNGTTERLELGRAISLYVTWSSSRGEQWVVGCNGVRLVGSYSDKNEAKRAAIQYARSVLTKALTDLEDAERG